MDLSKLDEGTLKKLLEILQPNRMTYSDTPNVGVSNQWEQKYNQLNDDQPDRNLMYGQLNDLYKKNPELAREMQRRLLDKSLGQDIRELAPYRKYRAVGM